MSWSGRFEEEKSLLPLPLFQLWTFQLIAQSLYRLGYPRLTLYLIQPSNCFWELKCEQIQCIANYVRSRTCFIDFRITVLWHRLSCSWLLNRPLALGKFKILYESDFLYGLSFLARVGKKIFQLLTAVAVNTTLCWKVTQPSMAEIYWRFERTVCFHLQGEKVSYLVRDCLR